jgi:AcrR family transcriptional regulator
MPGSTNASTHDAASSKNIDERVRRTMDVTRTLLLRSGYKRTTMDEIARRADIGKGTIYLSWDTKDDLIRTLLLHEIIEICEELSAPEKANARVSELVRRMFMATFRHPLFRALYTYDREILGRVCEDPSLGLVPYRLSSFTPMRNQLRVLSENDLWDSCPARQFALDAVVSGFVKLHMHADIAGPEQSLAEHAARLADIVNRSFEAKAEPLGEILSLRTAEIFKCAADEYRAMLAAPRPTPRALRPLELSR